LSLFRAGLRRLGSICFSSAPGELFAYFLTAQKVGCPGQRRLILERCLDELYKNSPFGLLLYNSAPCYFYNMRKGFTYTLSIIICVVVFGILGLLVGLSVSGLSADNSAKAGAVFWIFILIGIVLGSINAALILKKRGKAVDGGDLDIQAVSPQNKLPPNTFV
jgi:hypothetical protein